MPPNYLLADQPVTIDVAAAALPILQQMTRGAGDGGLTNPEVMKCMLGFATRIGLQALTSVSSYVHAFVVRYDARFAGTTTPTDALLFAADIALVGPLAGICDCSTSKVYRTAAHYGFAIWTQDSGRFLVPCF